MAVTVERITYERVGTHRVFYVRTPQDGGTKPVEVSANVYTAGSGNTQVDFAVLEQDSIYDFHFEFKHPGKYLFSISEFNQVKTVKTAVIIITITHE